MSSRSILEELSELLFTADSEWPKVTQRMFNPLETVLPLMDDSSVGLAHKYGQFQNLNHQISGVLSECIDTNKSQFIDHLSYYSEISQIFNQCSKLVEEISEELGNTNDSIISDNKTFSKDLNNNSIVYGELLDTIEAMEFVKNSTEQLNRCISEKDFIKSQELIIKCQDLAAKFQLWKIPLLLSIKNQLEDHSNHLFEVVVEEIHSIIYLKTNINKNLTQSTDDHLIDISGKASSINKKLLEFIERLNDQDDQDEEDELQIQISLIDEDNDDNFQKLTNLLIVLKKLNQFDKLLEIAVSREANELHQLFNQIIEDIKLRYPSSASSRNYWQDHSDELILLEFGPSAQDGVRLKKFANDVFTKSLIVLQYHRLIYEISSKLNLNYSIDKIFDIMESSLQVILSQYIYDENISLTKTQKSKMTKKRKLKLFEFKDFSNDEMTDLTSQLQEFFPSFNIDDKIYLDNNEINNNLEVIVEPDVFNMRVMLEPLLVFVDGSKKLLPMSQKLNKSSDQFFLDFMRNEYLKQFNSTLQYYYETTCNPNDSFDILINNDGIYEFCQNFQKFLLAILEMLNTSLVFKEEYLNSIFLMFNLIMNRFQNLYQEVSDEEGFDWLQNEKLHKISSEIISRQESSLVEQEVEIILYSFNIGNEVLQFETFYEKASQLLKSVQWLLKWITDLVRLEDQSSLRNLPTIDSFKKNWELIDINYNHSHNKKLYLTLNPYFSTKFEKFIQKLQDLEENIMLILRYNLIYQSLYLVLRFFQHNEFHIPNEINEPDANILKLTTVYVAANKIFKKNLKSYSGIVTGIATFLDQLFIYGSLKIKRMNLNGQKKVLLNILILQQLLRNVFQLEVKFTKSIEYFSNFKIGDKGLLDQISKKKSMFTLDENKNMIRLIYSEDSKNLKRYQLSISRLEELYK